MNIVEAAQVGVDAEIDIDIGEIRPRVTTSP
jgi:hypothetical protein